MKQTNNAIKFLMAQYRAIFKQALVKGLASAVVLSAGLTSLSAYAATNTTTDPIVLDKGTYSVLTEGEGPEYTYTLQKDGEDLSADFVTKTSVGEISGDGTIHLKGQVTINNATFNVPSDGEGAGFGARVAFDNPGEGKEGGFAAVDGYLNTINVIGTNTFKDQLTIHSKTLLKNGGDGVINQYGFLTISKGAADSDLSAVDINIYVNDNGAGQLIVDPNIKVGNLTFGSGANLNLYVDSGNPDAGDYNSGERTITVADNKQVTFASGAHTIRTSAFDSIGEDPEKVTPNPTLVFSGSKNAQVVNNGDLTIQRPVTFSGGIVFNNNATVTTKSGDGGTYENEGDPDNGKAFVDYLGNITVAGSTLSNNQGATLTMGAGTNLIVDANSTFINKGEINIAATAKSDIDVASLTSTEYKEGTNTFKLIDLEAALGDFTSSGTMTLVDSVADPDTSYIMDADTAFLKGLGVDFTSTTGNHKVVLDGTVLRVNGSVDLSSASIAANVSGSNDAGLLSLNTLTFTTTSTGNEDLKGLYIGGIEGLKFKSGKADETESILVSGSSSANTKFVAVKSLSSDGNKDLQFQNATLILSNYSFEADSSVKGNITSNLIMDSGSELYMDDMAWTAKNITLNDTATFKINADSEHTFVGMTADKLTTTGTSAVSVKNGYLTVDSMNIGGTSLTATDKAVITVQGDSKTDSVDFIGGSKIQLTNSSLVLGNVADTLGMTYTTEGGFKAGSGYAQFTANNVEISLSLDSVSGASGNLTIDQANSLLGILTDGSGLVHLTGTLEPTITTSTVSGETVVKIEDLVGEDGCSLNMTFDTETTRNAVLVGVEQDISGGWKAVQTGSAGQEVSVAANGTLKVTGTNSGNYVQDANGDVVGVEMKEQSTLTLQATTQPGKIGEISGGDTATLSVASGANVSVITKAGATTDVQVGTLNSAGALAAKNVTVGTLSNSGIMQVEKLEATDATFTQGSAVIANKLIVNESATAEGSNFDVTEFKATGTTSMSQSTLKADTVTVESITFDDNSNATVTGTFTADDAVLTGNATLRAGIIKLGSNGTMQVGQDGESGGSAQVVTTSLVLNGGKLIIDPEMDQATATVFAQNFDAVSKNDTSLTTLSGDIIVGRNSALGLGGTEDAFKAALARYQTNGALSNEYGAYVYINRANLALGTHKLVVGNEPVNDLEGYLTTTGAAIYLGTDSAIQISNKAINDARTNKNSVFTDMSGKTIASTDGTLIVPANLSADDITEIFGTGVELSKTDGTNFDTIKVTTENGLFTGVINSTDDLQGKGDFSLTLADNSRSILSNLSNPTYEYVINVTAQESKHYTTAQDMADAVAADPETVYGENGVAIVNDAAGYQFLQEALGSTHYQAIEQGARLATFGGAVQALQTATNSTTDVVNGRLGMGNSAARLTAADNAQGAGIWIAPVYRNFSSDSFDANGLGYGADVDLFGAALGVDYTLASGIRIGGAFNVGSGDADGQGAGSGVSNDFDYFGLALYAGFSPIQNLNLSADLSYTSVDNDLEANTGVIDYNKFTASTDATAWSMGVGAQYLINGATLDVAPHIGLRYTNLDIDDYDLKVDGTTIAQTNGDSASVFSIPVGVSLSKDITAGDWTIRPAADFTVTMNFGDDDIESTTTFDGVFGDAIKYNTEFSDNVTYGAAFSVSASSGNLSFGLNAGYTGSSNTDEYTVGANARFVF